MEVSATVVFVAYATRELPTDWIPPSADVVVVHNDRSLRPDSVRHPRARHILSDRNIGFGQAVNRALSGITTARTILCNPDVALAEAHWSALVDGGEDEVVTVPLHDAQGSPTWVVAPYPGPAYAVAMAYRLGRLLDRRSRARLALSRLLVRRDRAYADLLLSAGGEHSLRDVWVSGAVLSVDTARLRSIDGFDPAYFLYMEDLDLCRRLAARHPGMRARVAAVPAGRHLVGAAGTARRGDVARHRLESVHRYVAAQQGTSWRLARTAILPRMAWMRLRPRASG